MATSSKNEPATGGALDIVAAFLSRLRPGTLTHVKIRHIHDLLYVSEILYAVHKRHTRSMTDDTRSAWIF